MSESEQDPPAATIQTPTIASPVIDPDAMGKAAAEPSSRDRGSRWKRRAVIVSVVVHVIGLICLLFLYLPNQTGVSDTASQVASGHGGESPEPSLPAMPPPPPADDVPDEQIRKSIEAQIDQVASLPDERKLSELEKNLKRLDSIASEQSVKEVTAKITSSLRLDPNQYQPKESVPQGEFDFETAQFSNVTRTKNESGDWVYQSTMVDAQGRTIDSPMPASEGETLYETFQQMKRYPMAAGIYRSVVMPLMQKMIEAQRLAEKAAAEAERMNAEGKTDGK